jgi:glycosyltransferase involved in cell wall biosynthesis
MKVLIVEPFYGGSHALWIEGVTAFSRHQIRSLSLEGRYWKWRMRAGSILLARRYLEEEEAPHLILASSMLDLPTFFAFIAKVRGKEAALALYCHEDQFLYPVPDDRAVFREQRNEFGGINWRSALLADRTIFNSEYHRRAALKAFRDHVARAPDHREEGLLEGIEAKSCVFPPAPDLKASEGKVFTVDRPDRARSVLIWNHRWEPEKGPEAFTRIIKALMAEGSSMDLILAGPTGSAEHFRQELAAAYPERTLLAGAIHDREEYLDRVKEADLILVTSDQDFFGISVVEAMHLGVVPILPDRLAYPEHLPQSLREKLLYRNEEEARRVTSGLIEEGVGDLPRQVRAAVAPYDIREWIGDLDDELERVAGGALG